MTRQKNSRGKSKTEPEFRYNASYLKAAEDALFAAFIWAATDEGHDYWEGICRRLREMREERKPI